jgi:dCMP deaminase
MDYDAEKIKQYLRFALAKEDSCMKHAVATVIKTPSGRYIIGWSGPPTGIKHDECTRPDSSAGEDLHICPAIHAERRALSLAAREGISVKDATIFLTRFPCSDCTASIIESGILQLVLVTNSYDAQGALVSDMRGLKYGFELSDSMLKEAKINVIIDPNIKP